MARYDPARRRDGSGCRFTDVYCYDDAVVHTSGVILTARPRTFKGKCKACLTDSPTVSLGPVGPTSHRIAGRGVDPVSPRIPSPGLADPSAVQRYCAAVDFTRGYLL